MVGVGVAPGSIHGTLARPGALCRVLGGLLLFGSAGDLLNDQLIGMPVWKRGQRQVGHVGIHPSAPVRGDLGAAELGGRGLVAGLMGQQMGVIPPAAGRFAITHPHQVDLVPHTRIGQKMA